MLKTQLRVQVLPWSPEAPNYTFYGASGAINLVAGEPTNVRKVRRPALRAESGSSTLSPNLKYLYVPKYLPNVLPFPLLNPSRNDYSIQLDLKKFPNSSKPADAYCMQGVKCRVDNSFRNSKLRGSAPLRTTRT